MFEGCGDRFGINQEPMVVSVEEEVEECRDTTSITLLAIVGTPNPKTMSVMGQINKKRVVILMTLQYP